VAEWDVEPHTHSAAQAGWPDRLHAVLKRHASGMQPSATKAGVDLAAARACNLRVESVSDLSRADELHGEQGPLFIHACVDADDQRRVIPSRDGVA
jgi:hypothetical protein